ncbi:MAG: N-acetyltransferase [Nodosilinea sp.]
MVGELLQGCLLETDQPDAFAVLEQMDHHHLHYPHWYLSFLGVDPKHRSQGHGSELLSIVLDQCDRRGLPAYLESSNPENVPFYQRHGFEVIGTIQAGSSPRFSPCCVS